MDIPVMKSVFPNFLLKDFNMFDEIISLKWETVTDFETWEEHKNLYMEMKSAHNYQILLECIDVQFWFFRGNGQIPGFYIKDMSVRGYENCSRYEIGDFEEECIKFYCSDIVIKNFTKIKF